MLGRIVSLCFSLFIALSILFAGTASSAVAADLFFYEGNGCTDSLLFEYSSYEETAEECPENDEARSLKIMPSANPGALIRVYDDPDGDSNNDWVQIYIDSDIPLPAEGICVNTFQDTTSYANGAIEIEFYDDDCDDWDNDNCLDGRVSYIEIYP